MSAERTLPMHLVAIVWFAGIALVATGFGLLAARELATPRVVLLGSGGAVSALVTAGDARLLIATGSDPAAFAAALEAARQPTQRRLDVVLLAGAGDGLLVPALVAADPHVRLAATLGPIVPPADAPALSGLDAITRPREVDLGHGMRVLVETAPVDGNDGEQPGAWRASVSRGTTRIVLLSDGAAVALFPPGPPASLVAVVGDDPLLAAADGAGNGATVLAFADAALSPREMRADAGAHGARWAVRVFDSEPIALTFGEDGLEIPADAAVALGAAAGGTPTP